MLALLAMAVLPARACPPLPAASDLGKDAVRYAYTRLVLCGWSEAEPAFRAALEAPEPAEASLARMLAQSLLVAPVDRVTAYADGALTVGAGRRPRGLAPADVERAAQRVDAAVPSIAELLRSRGSDDPFVVAAVEVALAWYAVRHGDLAAAELGLAALEARRTELAAAADAQTREELLDRIPQLQAALRDEPAPPTLPLRWTVQMKSPTRCRLTFSRPAGNDPALWRADAAAARHGRDAAIRTLLEREWKDLIEGTSPHAWELSDRLRARYTRAELRRAWDAGEASLRRDGDHAVVHLFGVDLPLPAAEVCVTRLGLDCSTEAMPGPRPLEPARWRALMRDTDLYVHLFEDRP